MDDEHDDPEVAADLRLRTETEATRPRRDFGALLRRASESPVYVDHWPCRAGCNRMVPIEQEAVRGLEVFNAQLKRRGEDPIQQAKVVFCDECRAKGVSMAAERNRKHVDALAALIRELRGGTTHPEPPGPSPAPEREVEICRAIRLMHHPDPEALFRAVRESRDSIGGKAARRARV